MQDEMRFQAEIVSIRDDSNTPYRFVKLRILRIAGRSRARHPRRLHRSGTPRCRHALRIMHKLCIEASSAPGHARAGCRRRLQRFFDKRTGPDRRLTMPGRRSRESFVRNPS